MTKKVYIIGIGGIGISAVARYYNQNGHQVFGSDKIGSELIEKLKSEGMDIIIGEDEKRLEKFFTKKDLVIYTEAIPETQIELKKRRELGIKTISYPESLAEIVNETKLIAVAGSHGKSTTSSMISIMLKNSSLNTGSVVGTLLKEFDGKNFFYRKEKDGEIFFTIEACEYKRSFLRYKPFIGVITNIDLDHLDYYKDLADYESAFSEFINNIKPGGYAILNGNCKSSMKLLNLRDDINYVVVKNDDNFPSINIKIPGSHILFDAYLAFSVGKIIGLSETEIIKSLENYNGVWRRSEIIGTTKNGNILMSDYGHHPTEISVTLKRLKEKYLGKKLFVVFQPHQYSRTIKLLDGFKNCFGDANTLIVPDIYESRDSKESIASINTEIFLDNINHPNKINGNGLANTLEMIKKYDKENPNSSIILLLGAGNVDDLRYDIELK